MDSQNEPQSEVAERQEQSEQPQSLPPQPQVQPANSAGVIVLQWLTYAFWGWTILATIWLVYIVVANFILKTDLTSMIPYAIAAVSVLLPLSFFCDMFYARKEPDHKSGVATVVMVIHAVIFALFGIGVLIGAVLMLVQMFISDTFDIKDSMTVLITLGVSALLYGATFFRTLNPTHKIKTSLIYRLFMVIVLAIFIVMAFVGPVARSLATRDDRLITAHIGDVNSAINSYVQTNQKLPASLNDVTLEADAKALVDKGLVTLKPADVQTVVDQKPNTGSDVKVQSFVVSTDYRYQLCTTYKELAGDGTVSSSSYDKDADGYQSYLSAYSHPAGDVCYKLRASVVPCVSVVTCIKN